MVEDNFEYYKIVVLTNISKTFKERECFTTLADPIEDFLYTCFHQVIDSSKAVVLLESLLRNFRKELCTH